MSENSNGIHYMLYISAAAGWMDEAALNDILTSSRKNNQIHHLTGVLLYGHNNFVQLLEGENEALTRTFEKIKRDPRHSDVTILASGALEERCFPGWQMGFKSIGGENKTDLEDFIAQAKDAFAKQNCELPVRLLQSFLRKMK